MHTGPSLGPHRQPPPGLPLHNGEVHRRPLSGEEGQIGIERGANSGVSLALPCQREGWGALLYTSLIGGIAGFSIWYWVLNRYSVDRIAPFGLLMPMFAMAGSVTLLNEQITSLHLLGAAFTIGGVAIAQFGPRMLAAWRARKALAEDSARRALGQDA